MLCVYTFILSEHGFDCYFYLFCILGAVPREAEPAPPAGQSVQDAPRVAPVPTSQGHEGDAWADSVLGGLEAHPPFQHCLMGPYITISEVTRIQGSCAPDITNHSKRHNNYKRFWKSLKDSGLWQHELYIYWKTLAGLSEVELRELMLQCVLDDTRKCYPNPPGVPYMGHKRA